MNLYCSDDEKQLFLEKRGYTVRLVTVRMSQSCYHNDMEYWDATVTGVFDKNGEPYCKPILNRFKESEWLDAAFDTEVNRVFKQVVLGIAPPKGTEVSMLDQALE
ncbi:MAG: hypothetical protein JSS66_06835 [Armatimonadetes bacterium]|nr:hypothetical protein [Armatimonadota bacterium]